MGWLFRFAPPPKVAHAAEGLGEKIAPLYQGWRWLAAALGVGLFPLALCAPLGLSAHQGLTALLLFVLVVGAVHARRAGAALATLGVVFFAHSALAIALTRFFPALAAPLFPGGPEYWMQTHTWLVTGKDPEYELSAWVPAHLQLTAAVGALGYLSMGLIPFLQGFHEVDLMNFYVGRLLALSSDAPLSLALGWHPWSVARGLGFCCVVLPIAWLSYCRFTGQPLGNGRGHAWRFTLGLLLLGADGAMKYGLLDVVRVALAARLGTEAP